MIFILYVQDTEVIVWDIVNEAGLFRLRGHKGVVTQAQFLSTRNILITRSVKYSPHLLESVTATFVLTTVCLKQNYFALYCIANI